MKSARLGVAVFGIGLAVALAVFAYLLDQGRAGARVIPGLGEAAEPEREQTLAVQVAARDGADEEDEGVGDEIESARRELPAKPVEPSGLVVHVVDEDGKRVYFADVLAYRGNELLRGDGAMSGTANLIPFDGPGNLRVELHTFEIARLEIPEGRGSYDIVVPRLPRVAGIVRVDGIPRRGIPLYLVDGSDDWLDWIAYGLETAGLHERSSRIHESTEDDGTFCYEGLAPDWSGVLRLANTRDYRFANGAQRLVLARPEEGLVLDVEVLRPELEIRGRVVFAGEPVPAVWELSSGTWGRCDELGRFSIHVFASKVEGLHLEFQQAGLGSRSLEGPELRADLGDVELLPAREIHFVVRSESGEPIAGARAGPRSGPATIFGPFESVQRASKPTDAAGRGVLTSLKPDVSAIRVSARGYALTDVPVPEIPPGPISVVLPRSAAVHVVLRDRTGRVPPGLRLRLQARSPPLTCVNGYRPEGDELTQENMWSSWNREDDLYSGEFLPLAPGSFWIDALRARVPFDLSAVDKYDTVLASAPGIVLAEGEWRRVELRIEAEPRTLLVVVRDTLGHPLCGASVALWIPHGLEPECSDLHTDRAGMVRTEPFYGGDVALRVSRRGFESRLLEHVAVPHEGATVEVRLAHDWWTW